MIRGFYSNHVLLADSNVPTPALVSIENGRFSKIQKGKSSIPKDYLDLSNETIIPGVVDTHAHINEPGRTDWEGFQTATRSAASGGITTVVDMPLNSIPATTTLDALKIKADTAKGQCRIDYGFWGGVIPGNQNELEKMVDHGALGFKCFLIESGVEEFPFSTKSDLEKAMPILNKCEVPLLVHAELESEINTSKSKPDSDQKSYQTYLDSRPDKWETDAIQMMIDLAAKIQCHVHIVHLSSALAIEWIKRAKSSGVPITVETCPHYLYFESEAIPDSATHFKCAPPIRNHQNREQLWDAVKNNTITQIVSDHSPCTPKLKNLETGNFMSAWGGIAGLQFSLSVVWTEMKKRNLSLALLSERMSKNTALLAGLENQKGCIAEGLDADFVVFDPEAEIEVSESTIRHRHKITPYLGKRLNGQVKQTYLRGNLIFDHQEPIDLCIGKHLKRNVKS